jgi:L-rhamnose mutarotase
MKISKAFVMWFHAEVMKEYEKRRHPIWPD